jgi:hypothetical protein
MEKGELVNNLCRINERIGLLELMIAHSKETLSKIKLERADLSYKLDEIVLAEREKYDGIEISDHGLIRYLERKHKLDLDVYRDEILTPENIKRIKDGAKIIDLGTVKLVIKNNTVVTVLDANMEV